jgi:aspartate 1-decarboxylase
MFAKYLIPAVAVLGAVSAQSSCKQTQVEINSTADAQTLASSCTTFTGNIVIGKGATGTIDFTGLGQIKGDLIAEDNDAITALSGDDLNSISGTFRLHNLIGLSTLHFTSLKSVDSIDWATLSQLDTLTFGTPGIQNAKSIIIGDTFLSSLEGIDVTSLEVLNINNCHRLQTMDLPLANLSSTFDLQANGAANNLNVTLNDLKWIANMSVQDTAQFLVPSLQTVNGSIRFDNNLFQSFAAPNLTSVQSGDISFVSNNALTNISFPQLTTMGGGLLIANNTKLGEIDGFNKLKTVGGAIKLRGNFTEVSFDALNDVKGAFDLSSTNDISKVCDKFQELSSSKQGGGGQIQGVYHCESNNSLANSDTGGNTSSTGTTGGGSSSSGDDDSAASGLVANAAMISLAVVGGLIALL